MDKIEIISPGQPGYAYTELCRRWFAHYPDPFLRATGRVTGKAPAKEIAAKIGWVEAGLIDVSDLVRLICPIFWPRPSAEYWWGLHLRQQWRRNKNMSRAEVGMELAQLMMDCDKDGWDGSVAKRLSGGSEGYARWLLGKLPADIPSPQVGATPEGNVTFDWLGDYGHMVVIEVYPTGDLAYTFVNGDSTATGRCSAAPAPRPTRYPPSVGRMEPESWPQRILDVLRVLHGRETRR